MAIAGHCRGVVEVLCLHATASSLHARQEAGVAMRAIWPSDARLIRIFHKSFMRTR